MRVRRRAIRLLRRVVVLGLVTMPLMAGAADPDEAAQRQRLVALAVTHLSAEIQRYPQAALPGLDLAHPQVLARSAAHGRRLIFVSFESRLARWGQYETFELCAHSSRIERVDFGRIGDIDLYRATISTINPATPSRLPGGCGPVRG